MNIDDVWTEYRSSLKSFLHSRISDADQVDDLLQDVLIKTHDNLDSLQDESSVRSWLFQVAKNATIDFYRKEARSRELTADELWYADDESSIHRDLSRCIEPFIQALPAESAQLLTAIDLEGRSQKDYALEQDISYSTLKSRVQKSRSELRTLFEKCCRFSVDASGNLVEFEQKTGGCENC